VLLARRPRDPRPPRDFKGQPAEQGEDR
jgi:hypothetical protein